MKKLLWATCASVGILLGGFLIAGAVNCGNVFPTSFNAYVIGCTIPSGWGNALEQKMGLNHSTVTSSLDYQVNALMSSYGSEVVATSALNIVAGSGITVTKGPTSSITIATTGGGGGGAVATSSATSTGYFPVMVGSGLIHESSSLYQSSSTGYLGVNTTTPGSQFTVVGGIAQSGGANSIASTTVAGNATTTNLTVTGVTNAIHVGGANGSVSGYAGSACATGSMVTSVSATGTVACQSTSTVLSGYSTSTGANPTASIGTAAVNGTSPLFMRADGAPALGTQFASGTVMFPFYDATTTWPYRELKVRIPYAATIGSLFCDEYAAATSTMSVYRVDSNGTTTVAATVYDGLACGIGGVNTSTFTSSTIPAGTWLMAVVSSTAGTPSLTQVNIELKKN